MNYDKNGNITNLHRTGGLDDQVETLTIDNLTYSYPDNSNQLAKVKDDSNEPQGFKDDTATDPDDATNDYQYDANGNMIADQNKGINKIGYNHLNLPTTIYFDGGNKILYLYDATGKKVKKVVDVAGEQTITHYLDGFQYKADELQFFATAEGYANISHTIFEGGIFEHEAETTNNQYSYIYNYVDHLGNIRLSYGKDPSNGVLRIIEENHYYPFGLKHTNYNNDMMILCKEDEMLKIKLSPNNIKTGYNYKYNGKEFQDELGLNLYDYGARNYDPALGRWMNIDPLAEMSRRCSPYVYALNNPVFFIDPDGMLSQSAIDDLWNKSGSGETKWTFNGDGTASGSNGATANVGEDDQEKQKGVTPVNEKNKKNISKSSYGETAGLYPVKTGKDKNGKEIKPKNKDLFNPNSWDADLLKQLLKARAAINLLAARGASLHTDSPDLNDPIEKLLAAYHLTDNLPEVDSEIKDDKDVMFFYLSSDKNKKTPSISSKYWDQTTVKTYGPFYSIGGGDAGTGAIYLLFYKAVKKQ